MTLIHIIAIVAVIVFALAMRKLGLTIKQVFEAAIEEIKALRAEISSATKNSAANSPTSMEKKS